MLTGWLRGWSIRVIEPIARKLGGTSISPNLVTIVGTIAMVFSAFLLASGRLLPGAFMLIFGAIFDALDGAVARATNKVSAFGAFLDSSLDRFSEAAIYFGLLIYCLRDGLRQEQLLIYIAIIGSLMVSYTRARAEGVGAIVKGGIFTRLERLLFLFLGLVTGQLTVALWLIAIFSNLTALQRIWLTYQVLNNKGPSPIGPKE